MNEANGYAGERSLWLAAIPRINQYLTLVLAQPEVFAGPSGPPADSVHWGLGHARPVRECAVLPAPAEHLASEGRANVPDVRFAAVRLRRTRQRVQRAEVPRAGTVSFVTRLLLITKYTQNGETCGFFFIF